MDDQIRCACALMWARFPTMSVQSLRWSGRERSPLLRTRQARHTSSTEHHGQMVPARVNQLQFENEKQTEKRMINTVEGKASVWTLE